MKRQHDKVISMQHVKELYDDLSHLKAEYQKILDGRPAVIKLIIKSDNTMKRIDELLYEAKIMLDAPKTKKINQADFHELSMQFNYLLKLAEAEITSAIISMREQNTKLDIKDVNALLTDHPHEYHYLRMIGMLLQKHFDEKPFLVELAESDHDKHHARTNITKLHYQKFE